MDQPSRQLSWANVLGVLTAAALGAFTTLLQFQLSTINSDIASVKHDREMGDAAIIKKIDTIDAELLRRAELFLTIKEFHEFKEGINNRISSHERRLDVIEANRPTGGELSAASKATDALMNQLESRLRALEAGQKSKP